MGDTEILAVPLGTLATPGSDFADTAYFRPLEEAQPGGSDPVARLADMDAEGIDQAVLYPSVGLYFWALDDPAAAVAVAQAYNDWLAGYCAAAPDRLFGAAMLPMQDPAAAVAELRRAVTELGFTAAFVRPNPCRGRSLCDPAYDPIWEAAEELDVAIGVHEGSSVIVPTLGSDRPFNPLVLHALSHSFEEMLAYAQLAAFGVLERHPASRSSSSSPAAAGSPSGWSVSTSRPRPSAASAPRCAAAERVLRPAVLDQLRGRRADPARPAALRRGRARRVGLGLPAPRRHLPRRGRGHQEDGGPLPA